MHPVFLVFLSVSALFTAAVPIDPTFPLVPIHETTRPDELDTVQDCIRAAHATHYGSPYARQAHFAKVVHWYHGDRFDDDSTHAVFQYCTRQGRPVGRLLGVAVPNPPDRARMYSHLTAGGNVPHSVLNNNRGRRRRRNPNNYHDLNAIATWNRLATTSNSPSSAAAQVINQQPTTVPEGHEACGICTKHVPSMYGTCGTCKGELCQECAARCDPCPYCRSALSATPVERSCAKGKSKEEGGAPEGSKGAGPSQPS